MRIISTHNVQNASKDSQSARRVTALIQIVGLKVKEFVLNAYLVMCSINRANFAINLSTVAQSTMLKKLHALNVNRIIH